MEKHIVIARRFRPKNFEEIVGQPHITNVLKNQIKEHKIPQSIILAGQRGLGKTTTARIFSKAINCLNPVENSEPCNKCEICDLINKQAMVDIIEIDGASNRGINEIRVLRDNAQYSPAKAKYKVYIIDEVHMLTREAFNALLKILEEPPSHIVFLMATTEPEKIPITIRSRCQVHNFKEITFDDMKLRLSQIIDTEGRNIDKEGLAYIIEFAKGSMRDAESILEKVLSSTEGKNIVFDDLISLLGIFDSRIISDLYEFIYAGDCNGIIDTFYKIKGDSPNYLILYEMLIDLYHKNIKKKIKNKSEFKDITLNDLLFDLKILLNIEEKIQRTSFKDILLETTLLHIISKGRLKDIIFIKDMLKNLNKLEKPLIKKQADISSKNTVTEKLTKDKSVNTLKDEDGNSSASKDNSLKEALHILEKQDYIFYSFINHIDMEIKGSTLIFHSDDGESSKSVINNPDKLKMFENILTEVFKKPIKIKFEVTKKKNKLIEFEISPDIILKDPKVKLLLDTFKAEIEDIE